MLIGVLLLAAYLRLNHLGWTEFKLDEANLSRLSLNLVRGVEFPLIGLGSSTGIVNLPLAPWLMAIPFALSPSPIVATGFVAMLNVLAVAGCYALARRLISVNLRNLRPGLAVWAATLLFAVAPWAVIHSRKIWAQDLLPLFVVAWAWTGWLGFVRGRSRALIGHALALGACIQLHYSGLWLIPVTLAWAIVFGRRAGWRALLVAATLFVLMFAPFLLADIANGAPYLTHLLEIARQPATVDDQALRLTWLMITGQEIHSLAGPQQFQNFLNSAPAGETGFTLDGIVGVLALAGALVALVDVLRAARRRSFDDRSAVAFMLVTWLALPVLLQLPHALPIYLHYFIILYPGPFVLVGWLVSWLGSWLAGQRSMVERAVVIVSVLIALLQSAQSIALQQFLASRSTPGGYGVPVEMSIRLADEVTRASRAAHGAEALIYTEGDNRFVHEIPSVMDVLLPPDVPRRFVDLGQTTVVYPRDVAVVVVHSPQGLMLPDTLMKYVAQSQAEAVVAFRSGEADAQVRLWPGQQATTPPCADTSIGQWQNGVTLLTARLSGDWIELCYRVNVDRPGVDYHWFNHIIGPDGQRVAQIDGVGYPAASWRIGDVIMARFGPVQLPGDPSARRYVLRVGMYTYPDIVNVPAVDAVGNPVGDSVQVPLDSPR